MKATRKAWKAPCPNWDVNRLVFLDESGAKTNRTRLRGRAPRGQRVYDSAPHGHGGSTTMISSIRRDGATACMVVEGATDENVFWPMFLCLALESAIAQAPESITPADASLWFAVSG
jgi:hypothetical protein